MSVVHRSSSISPERDWVFYYISMVYPSLALFGLILNLLIAIALRYTNLNRITYLLITAQALNNVLGFLVNGVLVPWIYNAPDMFKSGIGQRLPGFLALFAMCTGAALCVCLSFSRFVFIWFPIEAVEFFGSKMITAMIAFPLISALIFASTFVFDCCSSFEYNKADMLKWSFYGPSRESQLLLAVNTEYCMIALSFVFNTATAVKCIQIGRRISSNLSSQLSLSPEAQKKASERFWRDVYLSLNFLLVTVTWTGHVTIVLIIETKKTTVQWTGLLSETFRCLLFLIDPLVHLGLNAELNSACKEILGKGMRRIGSLVS